MKQQINEESPSIRTNLKNGKVTLVDFIFTNCITVCPPMTYNMSQIQGMLDEEGVTDYQIVSFSVDPENDSPEVLSEYISNYEANEDNWHLVTGYKQEFISQLALNSFKTIVQNDPTSDQVIHGVNFYLVDQKWNRCKRLSRK
ncbi:SCO family protein [Bacillus coahuilensis]|uniref:SCO family protein n=1 Tax=Bacillus coahuilensis TaxID=408580 RepID=UPI00307AB5B3